MNLVAGLRMGIYEDQQIHTKTGSRPIKSENNRSGPCTNRMAYKMALLLKTAPLYRKLDTQNAGNFFDSAFEINSLHCLVFVFHQLT